MKEINELVSVIVPVYNIEKFLSKCIASIVNQTYNNLEIILIDDGSQDLSGKICDEWKKRDNRIVVIHKTNGGLSDARNVGLDMAKGTYYSFVDGDDYISADTIDSLLTSLKSNSCEIAICNMIRFTEEGDLSSFYQPVKKEQVLLGDQRFQTLNQPSVCNKLFKAKLFENIRFPKGKYYEDTFVYHELLYRAQKVVLTGKDSYWYLSRNDSIIGSYQYTDQYFDFIEAVWERAKFLLKNDLQPYGNEACLSLYAAFSNAEKNIGKTMENKEKFKKARMQYELSYRTLLKQEKSVSMKQKIRLIVLKYFPILHSKIY